MSAMHSSNIYPSGHNALSSGVSDNIHGGYANNTQSRGISAVYTKPNRHLMDPEVAKRNERNMANNVSQAVMGQERNGNAGVMAKETKLTAAAVPFVENHPRGMKNTAIRHTSPDPTSSYANRPQTGGNRNKESRSNERLQSAHGFGAPSRSLGRSQKNFSFKHRQAHYADPVDYGQVNYEKRIKDLAKNKITKSQLSSKVIETWINETLLDATHLDIPGVLLKPESKKPLNRYGISREELTHKDYGVSHLTADRIYRALFVYSLGFYEMLSKALAHSE